MKRPAACSYYAQVASARAKGEPQVGLCMSCSAPQWDRRRGAAGAEVQLAQVAQLARAAQLAQESAGATLLKWRQD
jgi:hypothetical protein